MKRVQIVAILAIAVLSSWMTLLAQSPLFPTTGTVNAPANLRGGPGTDYPIVGGAAISETITLVDCNTNCTWFQLDTEAWIASFLVDLEAASQVSTTVTSTVSSDVVVLLPTVTPTPRLTPMPTARVTITPRSTITPTATITRSASTVGPRATSTPTTTETITSTATLTVTPEATQSITPTTTLTATSSITSTAIVTSNLRAGPGTTYAIVGSATTGQPLEIVGRNAAGDWYQLADGSWIAAFLVANPPADVAVVEEIPTPAPTSAITVTATVTITPRARQTTTPTATITATSSITATTIVTSNLRAGPGTDYPIVGSAAAGQALEITGRTETGDWYRLADGSWIAAFLVSDPPADVEVVEEIATPEPTAAVPVTTPQPLLPLPTPTPSP